MTNSRNASTAQMKYRIEARPSVEKDFRQIDLRYHRLIWEHIEALSTEPYPRGCVQLEADENIYRIRVGVYRVFYSVDVEQRIVCIEHVKHRQSAYKK